MNGHLLDERNRPDLRDVFGALATRSRHICVAIQNIRLTGVDLTEEELDGIESIRVMLGSIEGRGFLAEANLVMTSPERRNTGLGLLSLLQTGIIDVRVASLTSWVPDFSVFSDESGPTDALLGFHWFQRPYALEGPAFAVSMGPTPAAGVLERFDGLWPSARSVTPALIRMLELAANAELVPPAV